MKKLTPLRTSPLMALVLCALLALLSATNALAVDLSECDISGVPGRKYLYEPNGISLPTPVIIYRPSSGPIVTLKEGWHYTVTLTDSQGQTVTKAVEVGDYTLTIAARGSSWTGTMQFPFTVIEPWARVADTSQSWYYCIYTTADLDTLAALVNSGDLDMEGVSFRLMNDLAYDPDNLTLDHDGDGINESNYTAIGCYIDNQIDHPFRGHFDACGHAISGIRLYNPRKYQGIFGYIKGTENSFPEVKNLTLTNTNISGKYQYYVGGIVGRNSAYYDSGSHTSFNGGIVTNCHVTNTVAIHCNTIQNYETMYIGGMIGINGGTISHCTSEAQIICTGNGSVCNVGGIIGGGSISHCISNATFTFNTGLQDVSYIGGIVGDGSNTISYCTSTATFTFGTGFNELLGIGGISGHCGSSGFISHCLVIGFTVPTFTNTQVRCIASILGCSFNNAGTLDHNYYYDCNTLGQTANVGYGYVEKPSGQYVFYVQDLPENDGAVPLDVLLHDDGTDNTATIAEHLNETNTIAIFGRTLHKDGTWNTLCLPFGVDNFGGTPLEDADVRELESATLANGVVTLSFGEPITSITAGTPYIVRWAVGGDDLYSPVFGGATMTATEPQTVSLLDDAVSFIGNFVPFADTAGLLLDAHNAHNGAFRAALQVPEGCEVVLNVPPVCLTPTDFAVGNITLQSAELGWNVIYPDEGDYTVRYRPLQSHILEEDFSYGLGCGWTLRDCNVNRTRASGGEFIFLDDSDTPQYLISPLLTDVTEDVTLEFNYQHWSRTDYTIQVGFSSTDNASDSFTFIDPIPFVTPHSYPWSPYSVSVPAGTKYICWKYWFLGPDEDDGEAFLIDDIVVVKDFPDNEWQTMNVVSKGPQINTTLDGLAPQTTYEVQVKSDCGEEDWSEAVSFRTLDPGHFTVSGDEYIIYTATGWECFCDALQDNYTYNHFSGKTVKLGADISVSRAVGSTDHEFRGFFDGQGHTLDVNIVESETWAAPFKEIMGATIRNLKVTGSVAGKRHSAGLVAVARKNDDNTVNTIENCHVSTAVSINNDNAGYMGGIVGHGTNTNLVIRGCVFDGSLTSTANSVGGLQGWSDGNTLTLEDNLFAGTVSAVTFHPVALHNSGKTTDATVSNVYYTVEPSEINPAYIAATGCLAFNDPSVSPVGDATATYDVSSLAVYGNGIQFGSTFYYYMEHILRHITGYGDDITTDGGWYLIASPLAEPMTPTADNGFLTAEFDLYRFDQSEELEWRNYKEENFSLENGTGYLYANQANTTLVFDGMPYSGSGEVALVKAGGGPLEGWNLIGNPFRTAKSLGSKPFYRMNDLGTEIIAAETSTVEAMEGVFVVANTDGETVTFATPTRGSSGEERIVINLCSNGTVIDRAIVRFGEGEPLPKLQIRGNAPKVYVPQGGKDYAVVAAQPTGELPLNFKATRNGEYTLTFNLANAEMDYLHLIDNMTGVNVDLLTPPAFGHPLNEGEAQSDAELGEETASGRIPPLRGGQGESKPASYTFTAKTTDYASRFKLVFSAASTGSAADEAFAFIDAGGNIVITADAHGASLQVIDMMGRVIVSVGGHTRCVPTTGIPAGVYVLRLIKGDDVKTQKIVVE